MRKTFKKRLGRFSLLVIVLLVGLQFVSGCGGCGSDEEEEATVGVEGEACPDVSKVTADAHGIHYPCDICANPTQSNLVYYTTCGTGFSVGDIKSFDETIECNTTGTHVINYTTIKHGENTEQGYSSYTYAGAVAGDFTNTDNPLKDGCLAVEGTECGPIFSADFINPTQWGVNIVWPCSSEVTVDVQAWSSTYTTDGSSLSNVQTGTPGWDKKLDQNFARSFRCPDCTWSYSTGDRYLVIMTDILYCVVQNTAYDACVDENDPYEQCDDQSEEYIADPAYSRYSYEVWTSNSSDTQLTPLMSSTFVKIFDCN